jgi:hypothetical protein
MKPTMNKSAYSASRRSTLKGALVGVTGLAAAGGVVGAGMMFTQHQTLGAHADSGPANNAQAIKNILNIAATAESLAVVFYTEVLAHADNLGLKEATRLDIRAALIEEQLHLLFLLLQGAKPLTTKFSFPLGEWTFKRLDFFLKTQQILESAFVAAYLAAVKQFAMLGRPDLAQVAAQIGAIEAEHRVAGRLIGALFPINNEAFPPLLVNTVADAATFLTKSGFLSPKPGNTFTYSQVSTNWDQVIMTKSAATMPSGSMVITTATPAAGAPPLKF